MPEASEFFKMIFELILHYYFFDLNLFYFKFIFIFILSFPVTQARAYVYKAVQSPEQNSLEPIGVVDFTDVGGGSVEVLN
jgi:hypothetical protein